jgi:hypothetical protein
MKTLLMASLALSLAACGENKGATYSTWAEAKRAGAVERGWIPPFVPTSARGLDDRHNLDTNRQRLEFTVPAEDVGTMIKSITPRSDLTGDLAARALAEAGQDVGKASEVETILMCTQDYSGILVANPHTGRAVYVSPVEWAQDRCPRPI